MKDPPLAFRRTKEKWSDLAEKYPTAPSAASFQDGKGNSAGSNRGRGGGNSGSGPTRGGAGGGGGRGGNQFKGKVARFFSAGWHTQCALTSTGKAAAPREPLKAVGVTTGAAESTHTSAISWTRPAESGAWRSTAGLGTTRSAPSRQKWALC